MYRNTMYGGGGLNSKLLIEECQIPSTKKPVFPLLNFFFLEPLFYCTQKSIFYVNPQ